MIPGEDGREPGAREQGAREPGARELNARELGAREPGARELGAAVDAAGSDAALDSAAAARARRLLRWYPAAWRARYGEEFAELLIAEISERPPSRARSPRLSLRLTLDVARGGLVARLGQAGLCGFAVDAPRQARASLASLGCAAAVFMGFGAALWSQLTIGWEWSEPSHPGTTVATVVMSATMLAFGAIGLLAAAPVACSVVARFVRGRARGLACPAVVFAAGAAVLVAGGRHFGNGWPGTGGHVAAHSVVVPAGPAAFVWASTLFVSSYWAHPAALAAFPAPELAWMAVSPLAMAGAVAGAVIVVRRAELSPAVLRFEIRLGAAACAVMAVFLAGCCCWLAAGDGGQPGLFRFGTIDIAGVGAMTLALAVAQHAARQARRSGLNPAGR